MADGKKLDKDRDDKMGHLVNHAAKHPVLLRLPRYIIAWFKKQKESQAVLVEKALISKHKIKVPDDRKKVLYD